MYIAGASFVGYFNLHDIWYIPSLQNNVT